MRKLITNDIFKMSKILKKIGVKIDVKGKSQEQVGSEMILQVLENAHLAQAEINDFLGSLAGITAEQFDELPIEQSMEIIQEFKNTPGVLGFFKAAGQLTK